MIAAPHPKSLAGVAVVVGALREGLGVEDMAVRGLVSEEYARGVVSMLRDLGSIEHALGLDPEFHSHDAGLSGTAGPGLHARLRPQLARGHGSSSSLDGSPRAFPEGQT